MQPGGPGHVPGLLPGLGHAAAGDLLDVGWLEASPLYHRGLHVAEYLCRVKPCQRSAPPANRRPDGFHDDGSAHVGSSRFEAGTVSVARTPAAASCAFTTPLILERVLKNSRSTRFTSAGQRA